MTYMVTYGNSQVLLTEDPKQKALLTHHAWQKFQAGGMPIGHAEPPPQPARPTLPQVPRLASRTPSGGNKSSAIPRLTRSISIHSQLTSCCSHFNLFLPELPIVAHVVFTVLAEVVGCEYRPALSRFCQNMVLLVQLVPPKQVPTPKQSPLPLPVYM